MGSWSCYTAGGVSYASGADAALGRLLQRIEAATASFSAEEAAASVALLLAAPDRFLFPQPSLFLRTLKRALRLGRVDLALVSTAVSSLRRWLQHPQQLQHQGEGPLLQAVLPLLLPFLEASAERGDSSSAAATRKALLQEAAEAGFTEGHMRSVSSRFSRHADSALHDADGEDEASAPAAGGWTPHILAVRRSVLLLLGELGPQKALWLFEAPRDVSLPGALALHSCEEWGETGRCPIHPEVFLRASLPLGATANALLICVPIKNFVVKVARAAQDAPSRQERATLCELLYALVCCVSQRAAAASLNITPDGGPAAAAADVVVAASASWVPTAATATAASVAMAALYRAILPSILDLIASADPLPRQLLLPLLLRTLRVSADAAASSPTASDPRVRRHRPVTEPTRRGGKEGPGTLLLCSSLLIRRLSRGEACCWVCDADDGAAGGVD